MDFMSIILVVVLVYVAKPAFAGKGKLMQLENVKAGKEKIARKGLRICYLIMFFCALFMLLISFAQSKGFTTKYSVTFNEAFTAADGTAYEKDQVVVMTAEEANALYTAPAPAADEAQPTPTPAPAAGSCMGAAGNYVQPPCTFEAKYELTEFGEKIPGESAEAKYQLVNTLRTVFFFISLADIIFLLIFTNKVTDKVKKEKAKAASAGYRVPGMPTDAFNFSDDEPTAPDDPRVADTEEK